MGRGQVEGLSELQGMWPPVAGVSLGTAWGHREPPVPLLSGHPGPGELQDPGRPRLSSSFGPWGHTVDGMRTCSQGLRQRRSDGEAQSKMSVSNGTRW